MNSPLSNSTDEQVLKEVELQTAKALCSLRPEAECVHVVSIPESLPACTTLLTHPHPRKTNEQNSAGASEPPAPAPAATTAAEGASAVLKGVGSLHARAKKCAAELGAKSEALAGRIESFRETAGAVRRVALRCLD